MIYVDTSALIPIYIPEPFSPAARALVGEDGQVPLTVLHELELANAFERMVGRGLITRAECRGVLRQLSSDIEARRLARIGLDLENLFAEAATLSRRYTARFLARSLDLLHVAAAHQVRSREFVSADDRQLALAKASGLAIVDITRPLRKGLR